MAKSMTYGVLPERLEFDAAFVAACGEKMEVNLKGTDALTFVRAEDQATRDQHDEFFPTFPVGTWTARDTFNVVSACVKLWENGDDDAGNLASAILTVLGFEWI